MSIKTYFPYIPYGVSIQASVVTVVLVYFSKSSTHNLACAVVKMILWTLDDSFLPYIAFALVTAPEDRCKVSHTHTVARDCCLTASFQIKFVSSVWQPATLRIKSVLVTISGTIKALFGVH